MRWQHRLMVGLAVVLTGAAMATTGKLANGTGNLSKARREELIGKIEAIQRFLGASQDPNAEQLLAYTRELSQEVRAKKFGLVFEEHRERVDVELEENLPIVREVAERFLDHGGELNFLIEGENLAALKLLAKTHRGKVDVIYIDPPYNTGNKDFVYNDCYVDANDLFRHSKWLSFMEKRLKIARELLADTGVIFISIDDNEQAELKVLCDQIFGDTNYISSLPWQSRKSLQNDTDISINHEYIVCYAKKRRKTDRRLKLRNASNWETLPGFVFLPLPVDDSKFANPDNDPRGKWKADPFDAPGVRENLSYGITNPITGKIYYPPKGRHWRMLEEKFNTAYSDGRIVFGKSGKSKPQLKVFLSEQQAFGQVPNSWLEAGTYGTGTEGTKELQKLLGKGMFETVKPTRLITKLLELSSRPDALVLDFFAGSGTTGHAVMKLNAADGGKRRFILVTNNENGICERVTYERLRRVMEKEGYAARLKYLKVDYVPIKERLYYEYANELLGAIRELVELENGVDFAREQGVAIVQTDEELAALLADEARLSACRKLYKGHDVLMGNAQKAALRRAGVEVVEIPQYYYPELEG